MIIINVVVNVVVVVITIRISDPSVHRDMHTQTNRHRIESHMKTVISGILRTIAFAADLWNG